MRILLLLVILGLGNTGYGQTGNALDERNGFKDIKLLSDVTSYPGLAFYKEIKGEANQALYRATKGSYTHIGDVEIYKLIAYTYRQQIYQIEVTTEKSEKLFRSLEKAFGKINSSLASQTSYWDGEKVRLTYKVEGAKKIKLIYLAKDIKKIIALDKKEAVDSLTSEF